MISIETMFSIDKKNPRNACKRSGGDNDKGTYAMERIDNRLLWALSVLLIG